MKWKLRTILQTKLTVEYEQISELNLFIIRGIPFQIPKLFIRDTYSSGIE